MQETQEMQVQYLGWEDPLEELAAPSSLPEKSHGQRSLVGYSPKGRRVGPDRATEEEGPRIPFQRVMCACRVAQLCRPL